MLSCKKLNLSFKYLLLSLCFPVCCSVCVSVSLSCRVLYGMLLLAECSRIEQIIFEKKRTFLSENVRTYRYYKLGGISKKEKKPFCDVMWKE